jgi:LysM repeat protein
MIKSLLLLGVLMSQCVFGAMVVLAQAPLQVTPIPGTPVPKPEVEAPVQPVPPAAPAPASAEPGKYVIKAGDNPWTIAKNHGIKLEDLLKANPIKDPKNLKIGDVLILPAGVASQGAPAPEPSSPATQAPLVAAPVAGDNWELYTIKKGDNPWKIAKALKVDHQAIVKLNDGIDFTKLSIGQQIKVPKKP